MATVNKNFRIKNGLIVEGATATVGGYDVITKAQADQDYIVGLIGGTATSANTANTVVKRDASGNFAAGTITATFVGNVTGNVTGTVSSLSNHTTANLAEDSTNKYFTNQRALDATSAAYDASGAASAAQSAAITAAGTDATTKVAAEAALRVSGDSASVSTAAADATSKVAAEAALRVAADTAAIATAASDATTKVAAEAALRVSADTAAIATAAADATSKANAAQSAAEATAAAANTAQQNGTTSFTAINYNSVAKQVAATTGNIVTAAATTAISWVAADYRSAKLVVKAKNGVHTQVSDLVVTLDTANNVAVSEYGITYSNGTELAAVTADYSGSDVRIRVTPANNNTEVIVVGTLIK